jgi:PhzF family phenazine biosynthesis protein
MGLPLFQVDAFAEKPFEGNPAAVCLLDRARDDGWMQAVGREMNLSETAFLVPRADGYDLRWFTPAVEVDLCGHATLASAHVLWEAGRLAADAPARFHTRSGVLTCRRQEEWIEMDFPADPPAEAAAPPDLLPALGVESRWVGRGRFDYVVEVADEAAVRALAPDIRRVARVDCRGVIVTAPGSSGGFDFVSRFFGPAAGVDEDPVTGSAHCALAPFWAARLGRTELTGRQVSARGGTVRVRLEGDRVVLSGRAVTVLKGELII